MALMRRFEFTDATSNKFWEVTVEASTVSVRYGRIGTDGQTQSKTYSTPAEAKVASEKQIGEKLRKGYQEAVAARQGPAKKAPAKKAGSSSAEKKKG